VDDAAQLRDRIAAGEKISGPAARPALTAATRAPRFDGRIVPATFFRKAVAYLARDGVVLFDNPDAFLICAFKRDSALCQPGRARTPPGSSIAAPAAATLSGQIPTPGGCGTAPARSINWPPAPPAPSATA
jgi:hypothetical protein